MTREQAIDWCMRHGIDVSFRPGSGRSRVRLHWDGAQIEAPELGEAVRALKGIRPHVEDRARKEIPLRSLDFGAGMCRGRILRLADALRIDTVGELIAWADDQSDGLRSILDFRNVGDRTLRTLRTALDRAGVEEVP